jgi:GNAT superfamily N-acetyltransferase
MMASKLSKIKFHPLTSKRWADFTALFGERGACGGCWCMLWRLKRAEFESQKGEGNRKLGWCSVAPRQKFSALERSRILKKIDETPVWSITCFFIDKRYRRKGLSIQLIKAAVDYVKGQGGKVLEAYPVEPRKKNMPPVFAWTGLAAGFVKAGFVECARRSETRPIMRYSV